MSRLKRTAIVGLLVVAGLLWPAGRALATVGQFSAGCDGNNPVTGTRRESRCHE